MRAWMVMRVKHANLKSMCRRCGRPSDRLPKRLCRFCYNEYMRMYMHRRYQIRRGQRSEGALELLARVQELAHV